MIIIPRERTQTPSEKTDTEAKERYDDEPRREAFRAGSRWERGEDGGPAPNPFAIALGLWVLANASMFFLPGVMEGCHGNLLARCGTTTKWTYVFPGTRVGQYFGDWMSK